MQMNALVGDPEEITDIREVNRYISRILAYEKRNKCSAGVLLVQRRQFDGLYEIISGEEANVELQKAVQGNKPEYGIKFWPRAYFEALRERLKGNKDYPLPPNL